MADQSATPSVPGLQVPTHTSPLSAEDASATTSPARGAEMRNFLQTRLNKNRAPPLVHTWDFYHDRQDRMQSTNLSNLPTNGSGSEDRGDGETAYEARLEHLAVIDDVRKFWNVFNNFDITRLVLRDSVHLFHKGVKPVWEDPRNSKGGAWTFRVPKHAAPAFWQEVCMLAIGEQLQSAVYEEGRTTFKDDICGVSLGVRFNSMLVQIWNRDGEHTAGIEGMLEMVLEHLSEELKPREGSYYYKKHSEHAGFAAPATSGSQSESGGSRPSTAGYGGASIDAVLAEGT